MCAISCAGTQRHAPATARSLRVNHATVARRLASLETLLGRALFDRRAKGYVLTKEGKDVLEGANAMDKAALSVLRRLDRGTELSGLVRLAAGRVLAERFLIDRLRAFHERYPAIDLEVMSEFFAVVRAPETISAEHTIGARHEGPHLIADACLTAAHNSPKRKRTSLAP